MRMTRTSSWTLAALLLAMCASVIYMLIKPSTTQQASVVRETGVARSSVSAPAVAAKTRSSSGVADTRTAGDTAEAPSKKQAASPATKPHPGHASPRAHLQSETALLAESPHGQGMNVRSVTSLIKGDRFADFMDQLALEASASPLALDLTELYGQSANEASTIVDHPLALRIVCGMSVCGLSATAPSKEVFDAWFMAFIGNPSARTHGAGRHDKVLDDGTVEYRIVFSNDPERIVAIMPPR